MAEPRHPRQEETPPISVSSTSTLDNKTGSWKYIRPHFQDHVAPCNAGCPVGIDVEGYMNLLREGKVEDALELLVRENPMPAVTGRVCDHPCESGCNRRRFDEAVAIHSVERMLGDLLLEELESDAHLRTREERVAVIGSGPAGLACGYHLARLGYSVTVFESASEPGGMLRLGIPEFRLPRDVLDRQIERIRSEGVNILCDVKVGEDLPWSSILESFDAAFVATGAHRGRSIGMDGEDTPQVIPGLEFLKRVNGGERPDLGQSVVVVGGGNTAMDCARTALRLGARPVVLYRRSRAEMPAIDQEVEEAEAEGIDFIFLAAPVAARFRDGRLVGVECQRMRLGPPDESGRRRPVPTEEGLFTIMTDTVLSAIGEQAELDLLPLDVERGSSAVVVDEFGETSCAVIFAGGDITEQPRSVAYALGAGKRAALGIDRYLRARTGDSAAPDIGQVRYGPEGNVSATRWTGQDPVPRADPQNDVVQYERMNPNYFQASPRHRDRNRDGTRIRGFDEVNLGLDRQAAVDEALRCFNCGVCNRCEICLLFCPDVAISRRPDGSMQIDLSYCKGCGVCAEECPRGAITMTREGL